MKATLIKETETVIKETVEVEFPLFFKTCAKWRFDDGTPYGERVARYERIGEERYRILEIVLVSGCMVEFWSMEDSFVPDSNILERLAKPNEIACTGDFERALERLAASYADFSAKARS